jgi:TatA/E family protein of Tat protein translocase
MLPGIGPTELIVVLVIPLLIFGPKKLPDLGRSLGGGDARVQELDHRPRRARGTA